MTDFTSTTPSLSLGNVNTINTQLGGLQISTQSSSIVNASSLPFETRGVRMSVFKDFVNAYNDKEYVCQNDYFDPSKGSVQKPFNEMTTTDVCAILLKPIVVADKSSYVDYLVKHKDPSVVSRAQVFISHAWKYTFTDVVNALCNHFESKPDIFIWFDMFSNNQIEAPNLDFDWWSGTFKNAIKDFGYVVMVISPWNNGNPVPFTRAWCLFEMYVAKITNSKFEVAMSEQERADFLKTITSDDSQYFQMLGNINVKKSECFNEEDQKSIFDLVNRLPGKEQTINAMICELMREWCLSLLKNVDESGSSIDVAKQKFSYALMLVDCGEYDEALAVFKEVLGLYTDLDGEESTNVATTYTNMASVYKSQGEYPQALEYYGKSLKIDLATLGEEHPDVATTYHDMAAVYIKQGDYPRALEYYGKCLKIDLATLGEEHPDVATTYGGMAAVYEHQGEYPQALEYYGKCLKIKLEKLGEEHPDVATTYHNMASVYYKQGDYPRALEYYGKCLKIQLEKLGEEHPDVATAYMGMANVYYSQGEYPQALEYYGKSLKIQLEKLGEEHPDVATTYMGMAAVYDKQGDYPRAFEYYGKCLKIQLEKLGEEHPDVATAYNGMALVYGSQEDYPQALEYFQMAFDIWLDKLGANHPHTNIAKKVIDRVKSKLNSV